MHTKVWLLAFSSCFQFNAIYGNGNPLNQVVNNLVGTKPSAVILDRKDPETFDSLWGEIGQHKGYTCFLYKAFVQNTSPEFHVKPIPIKTTFKFHSKTLRFGWIFICFLEKSRSWGSIDAYLYRLLSTGHARRDNFLFLGTHTLLKTLQSRPLLKRFRNVVTIETDSTALDFYQKETCTGNPKLRKPTFRTSTTVPKWIPREWNCLSGYHFNVAGTDFPPFMYYLNPRDSKTNTWGFKGVNYNILKNGGDAYNFTISLDHPNNPSDWQLMGEKYENGSWDGVFGDLVTGKVEIASVSNPTSEALGLADFIGPFGQSKLIFVTANPIIYADAGQYAILHPFSLPIWTILIAGFLVTWMLHSIAMELQFLREKAKYSQSLHKGFMLMMALSLDQEIRKPTGLLLRLMTIMWLFLMIIMGTSYRCNLASYIVSPDPDHIPGSFKELFKHPEYKIKFDQGGISGWNFFKKSTDSIMKALVKRAEPTKDTCWCTTIAFKSISTVCAGWDFSLEFAAAKNLSLTVGDTPPLSKSLPISEAWFVFAIQNNSIFYHEFMKIGQAYFEQGIVRLWEEELLREQKYLGKQWLQAHKDYEVYDHLIAFQKRTSRTFLEKLQWINVRFIFAIFSFGIVVSTGFFLLEVYGELQSDFVIRMFRNNTRRIRKISRMVSRKISGEFVPSSVILIESSSRKNGIVGRDPSLTFTLIP